MTPKENARLQSGAGETTLPANYIHLHDLVALNLQGQQVAAEVVETLRSHFADPDAIFHALKTIIPHSRDIATLTELRGFCRTLQKRIEREVA